MSEIAMLPYQVSFVSDPSPIRIIEKSRQIGLSWSVAFEAVYRALNGRNQWYVGYNLSMAAEFILDCAMWADAINAGLANIGSGNEIFPQGKREDSIFSYKLAFANGRRITALSSAPMNLRSKHGDVIFDEAAFHPDLPGLRKAAGAHRIWGGRITVVSTHNGFASPFQEWVNDVREKKAAGVVHRTTFREAITDGLYSRVARTTGLEDSPKAEADWVQERYDEYGEFASEELDVIPGEGRGGYIPVSAITRAQRPDWPLIRLALTNDFTSLPKHEREIEITRWFYVNVAPYLDKLGPNLRHFLGGDFARSGDKSVFACLSECEDISYESRLIVELHNVPYEEQGQLYFLIVGMLPNLARVCLDSAGNGAWLAEQSQYKLSGRSVGVNANAAHYQENMPKFKAAFQNNRIRIPRHVDITHDLALISTDAKGTPKVPADARRKGTDGFMRHGDTAMALYMAWCATELGMLALASGDVPAPPRPRHRRRGTMWTGR